jgi:hypothetical protein
MSKNNSFLVAAMLVFALFLTSCTSQPISQGLQTAPSNPNATIAFFSETNLNSEMRLEYAAALQNAGLYNFIAEELSEEQVEDAVEIRLNYKEENGKFSRIPILVLEAEFLKSDIMWFKFTTKEESDKNTYAPWSRSAEKKFRQKILLERFLEEAKRIKSKEPLENDA